MAKTKEPNWDKLGIDRPAAPEEPLWRQHAKVLRSGGGQPWGVRVPKEVLMDRRKNIIWAAFEGFMAWALEQLGTDQVDPDESDPVYFVVRPVCTTA